jgi:hypothetical protein
MIKKIITCDRCESECGEDYYQIYICGENFKQDYEVCKKCKDKFKKWMND